MRQIGLVIKTEGDKAWVKMSKGTSCGEEHCPLSSSLIDDSQDDFYTVCVYNSLGAQSGDQVLVEVADLVLLRTAFMLYLLPIITGILSYSLLNYLFRTPLFVYGGTLLCVATVIFLLKKMDRKLNLAYRLVGLGVPPSCASCPLKSQEASISKTKAARPPSHPERA